MNMNDDKDMPEPLLAAHFDALRTELAGRDAPRCVEKELMQAFARQFPKKRRWYQRLSPPQWGAAGALCSLSVVAMLLALSPHRAVTVGAPVLGLGMDKGAAFIALESLERIEQEPDTRVVEADLPRAALAPLRLFQLQDQVARHAEQEVLQLPAQRVVAEAARHQRHEGFLDHVGGGVAGAAAQQGETVQRALVPPVQRREGGSGSCLHLAQQLGVGGFGGRGHGGHLYPYSAGGAEKFQLFSRRRK